MARHALVIGGTSGIGAAVVEALLSAGLDVTFTYRSSPEAATGLLAEMQSRHPGASLAARPLDLAARDQIEAFAATLEDAPPLAALVGVSGATYDSLAATMEQDRAEALMQVNFWAFTRLARAVIRPMTRARAGRIVAIGSVLGQQASPGSAAYAASKAALLGYIRTLAVESARRGVTVNYVAPGFVDTAMLAPFAAQRAATEARIPAGRYASPTEIAAVVAFLVSPGAGYVTGAMIPVDGGLTASVGVTRS